MFRVSLCFVLLTSVVFADEAARRWERQIAQFEESDAKSAPPENGILFVGSSSIRGWKLDQYFPGLQTINRGFGGSQMSDSLHFADRIVMPYRPKVVVVYAGDNDIAAGESPEQVRDDYVAFVKKVHAALPKTRILFVAIKPSLKRWNLVSEMRKANKMISDIASKDPLQDFVDIDAPMIGEDGKPRKELFADDGLHLNHEGYVLWSKVTLAVINKKPITANGNEQ
ncbi:MAG: hypothetical protein KDB27_22380 [Planctomycetales bacterium]|nr:hypothetical protein [Planctomycetales bacterium]